MIQRIQTIYFLVATAIVFLNGFAPGIKHVDLSALGIAGNYGLAKNIFVYGSFAAGALGLFAILGYKNRQRQMMLGRVAMIMSFAMLVVWGVLFYKVNEAAVGGKLMSYYSGALTAVAIIGFALGVKAVSKDEKMVKSLDRIR